MPYYKKDKIIGKQEAYIKACNYCAYQERLQEEVRDKLKTLKVSNEVIEEIISELIVNNFLNEERYAKAYAGGKYRIKKWGRLKIVRNLESKGVSPYCIKKGIAEIEEGDYRDTLYKILTAKKDQIQEENIFILKNKLSVYAIGKGYEPELVWETINEIFTNPKS